jgi:hypothetical protein
MDFTKLKPFIEKSKLSSSKEVKELAHTVDSLLTKDQPKKVKISKVKYIEAKDLPFKSEEGKYELSLDMDNTGFEFLDWMPNKTSLRAIVAKYGDESDAWEGKEIGLYSLKQNVSGDIKDVIYAIA